MFEAAPSPEVHMRSLLAILVLAACGGSIDDPVDEETEWFTTCGDPVCNTYSGPFEGVPICADEVEGELCDDPDATCDLQDDCNAFLICASEDPKDQTGGCPISQRVHKQDVRYLSEPERRALADELLRMQLATWQYRSQDPDHPATSLGFLIDDVPGSAAVRPDGERVDLYGYTSLAVAAIQAQQAEIDALKAEVRALRELLSEQAPPNP